MVQRFSLWTVVGIFPGLVAERITREESSCLVLTIDDRNVRLNVACQEPSQKLSTSIGLVGYQILWVNSELTNTLNHTPRGQSFLTEKG